MFYDYYYAENSNELLSVVASYLEFLALEKIDVV
jgi:hypothetical protein